MKNVGKSLTALNENVIRVEVWLENRTKRVNTIRSLFV